MKFEVTPDIALGVGRRAEAEQFYSQVLGLPISDKRDGWTEVTAGPLKLYLCDDDMPFCLAINVEDVRAAAEHLEASGCTRLSESGGEVFVRDPFGTNWCLSPKS